MNFLLVANWKMNLGKQAATALARELGEKYKNLTKSSIWVTPSYPFLGEINSITQGTNIKVGAQNAHWAANGAFTGEVSCGMLKDYGINHVIIGHSERRHVFNEDYKTCFMRAEAVLKSGMCLVYCIGETLSEREAGKTEKILAEQLADIPEMLLRCGSSNMLIAYEPVWAIGTGKTATSDEIYKAHDFIKSYFNESPLKEKGLLAPDILYGGSVNPENIKEISGIKNVAGVLIGGASNTIESFSKMINIAEGLV